MNTAPPDIVMNRVHGDLPFIGREFHKFVLPMQFAFPENVYFLYYTGSEKFTRLVEYKKFTRQKYNENTTIVGMEIPVIDGGKHYQYHLNLRSPRPKNILMICQMESFQLEEQELTFMAMILMIVSRVRSTLESN